MFCRFFCLFCLFSTCCGTSAFGLAFPSLFANKLDVHASLCMCPPQPSCLTAEGQLYRQELWKMNRNFRACGWPIDEKEKKRALTHIERVTDISLHSCLKQKRVEHPKTTTTTGPDETLHALNVQALLCDCVKSTEFKIVASERFGVLPFFCLVYTLRAAEQTPLASLFRILLCMHPLHNFDHRGAIKQARAVENEILSDTRVHF